MPNNITIEYRRVLKENLPEDVTECIANLRTNGIKAYLCGECVLRTIMGLPVKKYRIVVNKSVRDLAETGILAYDAEYDNALIIWRKKKHSRIAIEECTANDNGKHSIQNELYRQWFTCCAMAWRPGKLYDPTGFRNKDPKEIELIRAPLPKHFKTKKFLQHAEKLSQDTGFPIFGPNRQFYEHVKKCATGTEHYRYAYKSVQP